MGHAFRHSRQTFTADIEALDVVLADAEAQGAEHIAVRGDPIDHGPDPVACPKAIFFVPERPCVVHDVAGKEMMVNVGSVGRSRRLGDNRASYVLHDGEPLEFRRIEYVWPETAAKLDVLPIPDEERARLQEQLRTGI